MRRMYVAFCRRWGPDGYTLSAWAFKHSQETGDVWLRNRIDGLFLLLIGQSQHCQAQYQRERANHDA